MRIQSADHHRLCIATKRIFKQVSELTLSKVNKVECFVFAPALLSRLRKFINYPAKITEACVNFAGFF